MSLTIFLACLIGHASEAKNARNTTPLPQVIVVDEDNDGLPGAQVGPSRKDIEDLIKAIGRDPVSDELVDRIDAMFRPRWANILKFERVRARAKEAEFLAQVNELAVELTSKPITTQAFVFLSTQPPIGLDEPSLRATLKADLDRESAPRKTIKGRILDHDTGKPIVGAVISSDHDTMTRTNPQGEYSLKIRTPAGGKLFVVAVEAPGYALTQSVLDWSEMPESVTRDLHLPHSTTFGGRIIDKAGNPIAGADVELAMNAKAVFRDGSLESRNINAGLETFRSRTDSEGVYAFRNIPPDDESHHQFAHMLTASHPKYLNRIKPYQINELLGTGWEITLEPGFVVRGVVVDSAGKPIPNVQVTPQYPQRFGNGVSPKTTDAEGRFRFENLPNLEIQLLVRSNTYLNANVKTQADEGEPAETKIVLTQGEFLEGKVVDEQDKPVANVSVGYLMPIDADGKTVPNLLDSRSRVTRTRKDGTFRVGPVAKGFYRIRAIRSEHDKGAVNGFTETETGRKDVVVKLGSVTKLP